MSYNLIYDKNQSYYIYQDTLIPLYIVYLEMNFLQKKGNDNIWTKKERIYK
jgi:hypothetical protein